jgi:hypothetical protein
MLNCSLQLEGDFVDACTTPFDDGTGNMTDIAEYCESRGVSDLQSCSLQGGYYETEEELVSLGAIGSRPLIAGSRPDVLGDYFRSEADLVFGPDHYLVEGIVMLPEFSCELGPGQSHAVNLANMIDNPDRLFPLCESYAPALEGALDFAQDLIQTEYPIEIGDKEEITAVFLADADGVERSLSSSEFTLDFDAQILHILASAIEATDTNMRVEVTKNCEPVIR